MKKYQGAFCRKCELLYIESKKECPNCQKAVVETEVYSRFCFERMAFIATLVLLSFFFALFFGHTQEALSEYPLGMLGFLIFIYLAARHFFGMTILTERFRAGSVPKSAEKRFSWRRYFLEFYQPVRILMFGFLAAIALMLMGGVLTLLYKLITWIF